LIGVVGLRASKGFDGVGWREEKVGEEGEGPEKEFGRVAPVPVEPTLSARNRD